MFDDGADRMVRPPGRLRERFAGVPRSRPSPRPPAGRFGAPELDVVEHAFDHGGVSRQGVLAELRSGIDRLEGGEQQRRVLATLPALGGLLPAGGLRRGNSYAVTAAADPADASVGADGEPGRAGYAGGATALALALLAGPSEAGAWCAAVGMPSLGVEAAAEFGVDLGRLVLVPEPGPQWLGAVAALLDAFDVVLVRPGEAAAPGAVRRLAARLREREGVLVVLGDSWMGCEARLVVRRQRWSGLELGHGHLRARQVTLEVTGRGAAGHPRTARLWLPAAEGDVRPVEIGDRIGGAEKGSGRRAGGRLGAAAPRAEAVGGSEGGSRFEDGSRRAEEGLDPRPLGEARFSGGGVGGGGVGVGRLPGGPAPGVPCAPAPARRAG